MKFLFSALLLAVASLPAMSSAATLTLKEFNPGAAAIFPVTSTLIYGDKDAILVDAQFQKQYAKKVVEMVKASGKNLKYVFISHSDPDFYFGLDEIKKAFPRTEVISTAQTAYIISASKDAKIGVWKEKLAADAPDKLYVPTAITTDKLMLDGQEIDIRKDQSDGSHSYLWIPSLKTVLGGIPVTAGAHLWMADTKGVAGIDAWIKRIDDMRSLNPQKVIPGHYVVSDFSPGQLDVVKKYLEDYKMAVTTNKDSAAIIAYMKQKYPNLPGEPLLEFGAKVFSGEVPWHVTSPYPPIGKKVEVDFASNVFELNFKDNRVMSFKGIKGKLKGVKDTVKYSAVEVSPNVFMVYWHEPRSGDNVVHVQDWNNGIVYTNIAGKDNSFVNLKGTMKMN